MKLMVRGKKEDLKVFSRSSGLLVRVKMESTSKHGLVRQHWRPMVSSHPWVIVSFANISVPRWDCSSSPRAAD